MSEDFPQEHKPPQEGQEGRSISVVGQDDPGFTNTGYPDEIEPGPPTEDVPVVDPDDGRVKDYDLAWDMAHETKKERERAAILRKQASELVEGLDESSTSRTSEDLRIRADRKRDKAENLEYDADSIEDWVKVLHEHPIPESLMESEKITARGLAALESQVRLAELETRGMEEEIEQLRARPMLGVNGMYDHVHEVNLTIPLLIAERTNSRFSWIEDVAYIKDDQKFESELQESAGEITDEASDYLRDYRALTGNPETTLGQLRDLFIEHYKAVEYEPKLKFIAENKPLLEQIRNGTANPPGQEA